VNVVVRGRDVLVAEQVADADEVAGTLGELGRKAVPEVVRAHLGGALWVEYVDQPVGGRFDGEDSNFGLVTVDDEPYDDFVGPVTNTNLQAPHLPQ